MNKTRKQIIKEKRQPEWCKYPDAWAGVMGCWSLVFHPHKINRKFCEDCDYYKKEK